MNKIINNIDWDLLAGNYQIKNSQLNNINKIGKKAKDELSKQQKLGIFYTPKEVIHYLSKEAFEKIIKNIENITPEEIKVLEPSVGIGSFIPFLVDILLKIYILKYGDTNNKYDYIKKIFENNIYMCDIDNDVIPLLKKRLNEIVQDNEFNKFNIYVGNFLEQNFNGILFDIIIGNPPYGAQINNNSKNDKSKRDISKIDKFFNKRYGLKIKKESYSYFIVHSIELLKNNGTMAFITSDTFLTIGTFLGLRNFIFTEGSIRKIVKSPKKLFAPYTTYPTVSIIFDKQKNNNDIAFVNIANKEQFLLDDDNLEKLTTRVPLNEVLILKNKPLNLSAYHYSKYFKDTKTLSSIIKTVGGLTTGNNSLFIEEYKKEIHDNLIGYKYAFYNKSMPGVRWYSEPKYVIKWENNGENIKKYKKASGKWYLHGMGGEKYYFKEGLAINLIGNKINARYVEPGKYVFDAGSPMIIFNDDNNKDEMFFILGYLNSNLASNILKNVLNHTRNIQPKNIENLPYPKVTKEQKEYLIGIVKTIIDKVSKKESVEKEEYLVNTFFDNL